MEVWQNFDHRLTVLFFDCKVNSIHRTFTVWSRTQDLQSTKLCDPQTLGCGGRGRLSGAGGEQGWAEGAGAAGEGHVRGPWGSGTVSGTRSSSVALILLTASGVPLC